MTRKYTIFLVFEFARRMGLRLVSLRDGVCLTTNRASRLFIGRDGYFPQDPKSLPYVAANTLKEQEGPSTVDPAMVSLAVPVAGLCVSISLFHHV